MEYKKINIKQIKYVKSFLKYNGDKLIIELPVMKCINGIDKYFSKYQIMLEITDKDFLDFMIDLEETNKKHCDSNNKYKSNLVHNNNKSYLTLKVPYRYNRFEIDIKSDRIYLPTIENIKPNTNIKCKIILPKLWTYENISGCLMDVKEIFIE